MTIPEVAAALSIPLNTAYTRLRAVRADFERALARHQTMTSDGRKSGRCPGAGAAGLVPERRRRRARASGDRRRARRRGHRERADHRRTRGAAGRRGFSRRERSPPRAAGSDTGPDTARAFASARWSRRRAGPPSPPRRACRSRRHPAPAAQPALAPPATATGHHAGHLARHEAEGPAPAAAESLAVEVRALRNAERALRDGNPGLALVFLDGARSPGAERPAHRGARRGGDAGPLRAGRSPHRRRPRRRLRRAPPRAASTARASNRPARATDSAAPETQRDGGQTNEEDTIAFGGSHPVRGWPLARLLGRQVGQHREHERHWLPALGLRRDLGRLRRRPTPSCRTARTGSA